MDATIACLPSCVTNDEPERFEPVCFGDYVMERLNKNYQYRQAQPHDLLARQQLPVRGREAVEPRDR